MRKTAVFLVIFLFFATQAFAEDFTYTDEKYGFSISYPKNCRAIKNLRGSNIAILMPQKSSFDFFPGIITVNTTTGYSYGKSAEDVLDIYYKYSKNTEQREYITINGKKFFSVIYKMKRFFMEFKQYNVIGSHGPLIYIISYTNFANDFDNDLDIAKRIISSFIIEEKNN